MYLYECFDSVARGEAARGTRGSPGTSFNFQHFNSDVSSPATRTRHSGTFLYLITCREGTNITTLQTLIITINHITNITNGLFVRLIVWPLNTGHWTLRGVIISSGV